MQATKLEIGSRVKVIRQIGKDGPKEQVSGTIAKFPKIIRIKGEMTAIVRYDDSFCSPGTHALSTIQPE